MEVFSAIFDLRNGGSLAGELLVKFAAIGTIPDRKIALLTLTHPNGKAGDGFAL